MTQTSEIKLEAEFASTMQQLVAEAEKTLAPAPGESGVGDDGQSDRMAEEMARLNERMAGLEQVISNRLDKLAATLPSRAGDEVTARLQRVEEHLVSLGNAENLNQRLFNSLHQELKSYRDNFLRDSLQKPFIRDLVVLLDDLSSLSAQLESAAGGAETTASRVTQWSANLRNAIHALVEIMHRMEVTEIEPKEFVDRALHKVVSYEPADFAEDNGRIVMRVKRGFVWREQVLRPEEVVAKRCG